jgi:2-polyprenyl-3-methyl-5-hydroxy-6-metoxy-1,4-benzoquinol methylase
MRGWIYDQLRIRTPYKYRVWFKRQKWFFPLTRLLFGYEAYSTSYYADVERLETESVQHIADWIVENIAPRSVIDVGCGPGHMMEALQQRGVAVYGVDISTAALARVKQRGLSAERFDLTRQDVSLPGGPYDLVISSEVAEHLEERHARNLVRLLTEAGHRIYMTAAEPDPSAGVGLFHYNEQPNAYWINLMAERGFRYEPEITTRCRERLRAANVVSYLAVVMNFTRTEPRS